MSHISYSSLKIFNECPHKYKLNYIDNKKSSLLILSKLFKDLEESFDDIAILKSNSYSNAFFEYITKKYSITNEMLNLNDIHQTQKIYEMLNNGVQRYLKILKAL